MLEKMASMHDDIQRKLEDAYQQAGLTKKDISQYLDDPKNFPSYQWEVIQKQRKDLANKIWSMVGEDTKPQIEAKKRAQAQEGAKGKTLGARKRWIPVK